MRCHTLACCFALLVAQVACFGYTNYQLPQKTSNRIRWLPKIAIGAGTGTTRTVGGCTNRRTCESLDQVAPNWKFTAKDSFEPLQATVLIEYDERDFYTEQFQGIVIATGALKPANKQALQTGTRVYFSKDCTTKWTAATWTAKFGVEKAAAMHGKLINGVDLDNSNGWGRSNDGLQSANGIGASGAAPTVDNYPTTNTLPAYEAHPSIRSFQSTTKYTNFGDYLWGAGRVGQGFWESRTNNADKSGEDSPLENPNQQSNYLLCTEAQIHGVVNVESFEDISESHYLKASSVFDQSKYPQTYAETNRVVHTSGVTNTHFYAPERNTANANGFTFP